MQKDEAINIYLTPELKEFYKKDFINNVLPEMNEFWGVPDSINEYLIQLNESIKIQPLYSCFPDNPNKKNGYLKFAYIQEVEQIINDRVIPELTVALKDIKYGKFEAEFCMPRDNGNYRDGESNFKMSCITNPNHFRINHFDFKFVGYGRTIQSTFWQEMTKLLIAL